MPNNARKLDPAAAQRLADDILAALGVPRPAPPPPPLPDRRHEAQQALGNVVRLSDVAPKPIHWLSPGRLALGKVTVLDGDPTESPSPAHRERGWGEGFSQVER